MGNQTPFFRFASATLNCYITVVRLGSGQPSLRFPFPGQRGPSSCAFTPPPLSYGGDEDKAQERPSAAWGRHWGERQDIDEFQWLDNQVSRCDSLRPQQNDPTADPRLIFHICKHGGGVTFSYPPWRPSLAFSPAEGGGHSRYRIHSQSPFKCTLQLEPVGSQSKTRLQTAFKTDWKWTISCASHRSLKDHPTAKTSGGAIPRNLIQAQPPSTPPVSMEVTLLQFAPQGSYQSARRSASRHLPGGRLPGRPLAGEATIACARPVGLVGKEAAVFSLPLRMQACKGGGGSGRIPSSRPRIAWGGFIPPKDAAPPGASSVPPRGFFWDGSRRRGASGGPRVPFPPGATAQVFQGAALLLAFPPPDGGARGESQAGRRAKLRTNHQPCLDAAGWGPPVDSPAAGGGSSSSRLPRRGGSDP